MLEDIILRTVEHSPLTTKEAVLTWEEVDGNWIAIYDELAGIGNPGNVTAYNETHSYYIGEFVVYNSKLYRALFGTIPDDNVGQDPETEASEYWIRASAGELLSAPGREPVKNYTLVQLEQMKIEGRLVVSGKYRCTDFSFEDIAFPVIFIAATSSTFQNRVQTENQTYLMDIDSSDADSANWLAIRVQNYTTEINISSVGVFDPATKTLAIAAAKRHAEIFNIVADPWALSTPYDEDEIVEHNDLVYVCLITHDGDVEPGTSPSYWELIHGTGVPEIELITSISSTHDSKFKRSVIAVKFIATNIAGIATSQLALPLNTDIMLENDYAFLTLKSSSEINIHQNSTLTT